MKQFAMVTLIVGFLFGSTPHVLCVARSTFSAKVGELPKCPHCQKTQRTVPTPGPCTPSDERSPCCEGVDAVLVDSPTVDTSLPLIGSVVDAGTVSSVAAIIDPCGDLSGSVNLSALPLRSGRALTLLLGHLLF